MIDLYGNRDIEESSKLGVFEKTVQTVQTVQSKILPVVIFLQRILSNQRPIKTACLKTRLSISGPLSNLKSASIFTVQSVQKSNPNFYRPIQQKSSKPGNDAKGACGVNSYFHIHVSQIDCNDIWVGRKSVWVIIGGHIRLDTKISSWRSDSSA